MAEQCDCLNYCGDDPWLMDGRAEPCQARQQAKAEQLARQQAREVITALPDEVIERLEAGVALPGDCRAAAEGLRAAVLICGATRS